MRLYHGTSVDRADCIMRDGLLCRDDTQLGNYSAELASNPHYVYFTDAYPFFFAANAVGETDERGSVVAVDIPDEFDVLDPDEDFIRELYKDGEPPDGTLVSGELSLELLGTCRVHRSNLEFVDVVGRRDFSFLESAKFSDPHVTVLSHKVMKHYYRELTDRWFETGKFE